MRPRLTPEQAKKLLAARKEKAYPIWDISQFLFQEQIDMVLDPSRMATAVCSVRAGKTMACAADLINTAITMPGTNSIYITLARSAAERIVWPELKKINRTFGFKAVPNEAKLTMKFPNGSTVYLLGGNDEAEIEKIRGMSNVALVYLDEAQAFRYHVKGLVEDIVVKRLYDTNGRCRLIGSPGPVLSGYFYDCAHSPMWSHHHWTMHNNPWLLKKSGKTPEELIAQDCATRGVTVDDPSIQRECFGRWKHDPNALLLSYDSTINHYDKLPHDKYDYILGIDLGVKDSDSLSLLAYSASSPITWLVEEYVTPNQRTDDLAEQIRGLVRQYGEMTMVADTGGLGLKVCEDLMYRYGFYIQKADKLGKMSDYKFLNNALRTGIFKARSDTKFAADCMLLEKDDLRTTPDKIVVRGHSDAVDSVLYAFGLSPAYDYRPAAFKALPGTSAYTKEQEELHKQAIIERIQKEQAIKDGHANHGRFVKDKHGRDPWHSWDD